MLFYFLTFCICVSLIAQLVENLPACRRPGFDPWVGNIPWRREWLPTPWRIPWTVHGFSKSQTQLSDFHSLMFYNYILIVYIRFINLAASLLTGFCVIYFLKHCTRSCYYPTGFKSIKSSILISLYTLIA